jgi:hypothetical protein
MIQAEPRAMSITVSGASSAARSTGWNEHVSFGVRQVLGRAPRDVGDFAREAVAAGAWKA